MLNKIIEKCNCCIADKIYINEMQTKTSIILPFFQYLGYDTEDFFTFKTEYSCGRERVDYAIVNNDKVDILIETKKITENLDVHVSQISKYMKYHKEAFLGILTNGVEYRFFKRKEKGLLEVWRLNLTNLTSNDLELLENISKLGLTYLRQNSVLKELRFNLTMKNMLENPNEEFINLLKQKCGLDVIDDWDIRIFLSEYNKNSKKVIPKPKVSEIKDVKMEKSHKSLINKGFNKEEADWLIKYKMDYNFDLYKSIRFFINKRYSIEKFKLSELMNSFIASDNKRRCYILNNEKIFASICNKLIPEIMYTYEYTDDISNKKNKVIKSKGKLAI